MGLKTLFRTLFILAIAALGVHALGVLLGDSVAANGDGHHGNHGDDDQFIKVEGILDLPPPGAGGNPLTLPTATPVTVGLTFGLPSVHIDVVINSETTFRPPALPPGTATLHDGDRVKVRLVISNGGLVVTRLQLIDFFELRLRGTAQDLSAPVPLPLGGSPVTFTLILVQGPPVQSLPITITRNTRLETNPFGVLRNGDIVEVKAVVRDGQIRAVRIEREDEFEEDD